MVTVKIHFANILKNGFEGGREPLEIRFRDKDAQGGQDGSLEGCVLHVLGPLQRPCASKQDPCVTQASSSMECGLSALA